MTQKMSLTEDIKLSFHKIFVSCDPFGEPFCNVVPCRLILCPYGYHLDEEQFEALSRAAGSVGEKKAFVLTIEGISRIEESKECWEIDLSEYEAYAHIPLMMRYALYSTRGNWGLIVSEEEYAVLGSREGFMDVFKEAYPEWESQLPQFLDMWREKKGWGSDVSWLPALTKHVYGRAYSL